MNKRIISGAFALLMTASSLWAVPAKRGLIRYQQPDGAVIELQKVGDERSHVVLSPDGYPLTVDSEGYMCFAKIMADGRLSATDVRAAELKTLSDADRAAVERIDRTKIDMVLEQRYNASKMSAAASVGSRATNTKGIGLMDAAFVGRKELKGLVILAQYTDVKFASSNNREFFVEMLNGEGFSKYNGTGSARDFFIDNSGGGFIPEFDVYGPVTLNHPMSYYGGNDGSGNDKLPAQMIYDACKGLDSQINFADYDQDGDGYVDNVFVFYAGYGEASYGSDDSVWPHQWSLAGGGLSLVVDGVKVNKYACSNELTKDSRGRTVPDGIGTFVHEFSHVLGLPDLYVTSNSGGDWTPAEWSVMDQGPYNNDSRTPPAYSVYERYSLGWIDPIEITGPESVTLDAINTSNQGCIVPTSSENEFFLIENRQQTGWDTYIPGHGMLIWHIDYNPSIWTRNTVNNNKSHNYVDIEEACGTTYSYYDFSSITQYNKAMAGYAFPGTKGVTEFTDKTTPSMLTWKNKSLGLPITGITEANGLISFDVAGGRCDAAVPQVKDVITTGQDWFEAAWNLADGAAGYILTVSGKSNSETVSEESTDFGSSTTAATLPEGWEFVNTTGDVSTSTGQYGVSAPSLRLTKNGAGIMTRKFGSDVHSVEFWSRGIMTGSAGKIIVEGLINDAWTEIDRVAVPTNPGAVATVGDLPAGVSQIRLTASRTSGNVLLDDVKVTLAGGLRVIDGYKDLAVGNVTSYVVRNLPAEYSEFEFKVRALDAGGRLSAWSDVKSVTLGATNGVVDAAVAGVAVQVNGHAVRYSGASGVKLVLADLTGRIIAVAETDENGEAYINAPAAGFYVLTTPGRSFKLSIR